MILKARFDAIGKFADPLTGDEREAKTAHYTIGARGDKVSGGLYLPVGMEFPKEGITLQLTTGKKGGKS